MFFGFPNYLNKSLLFFYIKNICKYCNSKIIYSKHSKIYCKNCFHKIKKIN